MSDEDIITEQEAIRAKLSGLEVGSILAMSEMYVAPFSDKGSIIRDIGDVAYVGVDEHAVKGARLFVSGKNENVRGEISFDLYPLTEAEITGMVGDDRIVISTPYSTYFVSRGHPNYEEVNKVFENLRLKRAIQGICEMPTGQE